MKRHFYVSEDMDDLDRIEEELETRGVHRPQIHVFSRDDTAVETHDHLHNIDSVFKRCRYQVLPPQVLLQNILQFR